MLPSIWDQGHADRIIVGIATLLIPNGPYNLDLDVEP